MCLGIVRHYNDGWAAGLRHNIRYWEIWNEPDIRPSMWSGSDEDYLRMYETTARLLKSKYPDLKVGGPAIGNSGQLKSGRFEPSAFLLKFLGFCKDRSIPLDFVSWHLYTNNPAECLARAKGVRETLDRFGFTKTELHLNEWNYLPDMDWSACMSPKKQGAPRERFYDRVGNTEGAAFIAACLINFQDTSLDVANYYTTDTQGFGLFTFHGAPRKNYQTFKAFKLLLDTPHRVQATGGDPAHLAIAAGLNADKSALGILISNYNSQSESIQINVKGLPWQGEAICQILILDSARPGQDRIPRTGGEAADHTGSQGTIGLFHQSEQAVARALCTNPHECLHSPRVREPFVEQQHRSLSLSQARQGKRSPLKQRPLPQAGGGIRQDIFGRREAAESRNRR